MLDTDPDKVREALAFILSLAHDGLAEMRGLIAELRPDSLGEEGLVAALTRQAEQLGARRGVEIGLSLCAEPDLSLAAKEALYRIAQEAMLNAAKHAHSDRLNVRLGCQSDVCCLEVCDNGVGFDPLAPYPGHLGLRSMRERALSVGGTLTIVSVPECGTQIRAQVPVIVSALREEGMDYTVERSHSS
jgi:signal transduction histidine kinase